MNNRRTSSRLPVNVRDQRGAALMMILLLVALMLSLTAVNVFDRSDSKQKVAKNTYESLASAKQALIAYAVTRHDYADSSGDTYGAGAFGELPCPDMYGDTALPEGEQEGGCNGSDKNAVGRLPWRTLDLGPTRDGSGECLWYAVSGPYKPFHLHQLLNHDTPGYLEVHESDGMTPAFGTDPEARVVAAIFAPGPALQGQNRINSADAPNCRGNYDADRYLEAVGGADNALFEDVPHNVDEIAFGPLYGDENINDTALFITKDEIWDVVKKRGDFIDRLDDFAERLTRCIAEHGKDNGGKLPWAAPVTPVSGTVYGDSAYDDAQGLRGGRFPELVDDTRADSPGYLESLFDESIPHCEDFLNDASEIEAEGSGAVEMERLWSNWKDHVFYALAEAARPDGGGGTIVCDDVNTDCLIVEDTEKCCTAVILFAGEALPAVGQVRTGLPSDPTRTDLANYLDDSDVIDALENGEGAGDFSYDEAIVNDRRFCINEDFDLVECQID